MDQNPKITNDAPDIFPLGITVVTLKATDANGNSSTAVQKVTVVDTTKPELTIPEDITLEAQGTYTVVEIGEATASNISKVEIKNNAPEGNKFPIGTTVVIWTATDAFGNTISKEQKVTVVDTTKPELTIPADITVEAQDTYTFVEIGKATASDISKVEISNNAPEGNKFPIGTTVVTWTATDAFGNVSHATQKIIVFGMMIFKDIDHKGNIETRHIFSNGSIQINGSCTADLLSSSTNIVKITGKSEIGLILKSQPIQPIAVPDWQEL